MGVRPSSPPPSQSNPCLLNVFRSKLRLGHSRRCRITQSPEELLSSIRKFAALAYLLTWVLLGPWFYAYTVVYAGHPPRWLWFLAPLAFIGGWGPSIAGFVVASRTEGRSGVRRLLVSLCAWRAPPRWYVVVFLVPPLATALSLVVVDRGTDTLQHFAFGPAIRHLPLAYALALPFGPLGEEVGWRGFALPRLLTRFGPWRATVALGVLWTFWHGPMMLFMPGASIPSFMGLSVTSVLIFLVQITSETALMTLLYLQTRGSLFMAVLAHLTFNSAESVVFSGLPSMALDLQQSVYLVNVGVLSVLGLAGLLWVTRRSLASPAV